MGCSCNGSVCFIVRATWSACAWLVVVFLVVLQPMSHCWLRDTALLADLLSCCALLVEYNDCCAVHEWQMLRVMREERRRRWRWRRVCCWCEWMSAEVIALATQVMSIVGLDVDAITASLTLLHTWPHKQTDTATPARVSTHGHITTRMPEHV